MPYKNIEDKRRCARGQYHKHKEKWKERFEALPKEERERIIRERNKRRREHYRTHAVEIRAKRKAEREANRKFGDCEICGKHCQLCYDHCHETMNHRGWLCKNCNLVLGHAFNSTEVLRNAIEYLKKQT